MPTYADIGLRMLPNRYPILTLMSSISYPDANLTPSGALTMWWHGIGSLLWKQRPTFMQRALN